MPELQTGSTQGGHEHPTVELEHGQWSRGFCPRCPLSDQSMNGAIGGMAHQSAVDVMSKLI